MGTASAVVGGTAFADAVDVNLTSDNILLDLAVEGGTDQVDAPATNGTNTSGVDFTVDTASADVTVDVLEATATRGPDSLSASSGITSATATLFGLPISVGVITSSVECPLVGAPTATAQALGVNIGNGAVDLAAGESATATIAVTTPLGTGTVTLTATTEASTTADSASAVGLRITAVLNVTPAGAPAITETLGSIVLAETGCTRPTGPDDGGPTTTDGGGGPTTTDGGGGPTTTDGDGGGGPTTTDGGGGTVTTDSLPDTGAGAAGVSLVAAVVFLAGGVSVMLWVRGSRR